jgi:hypothetical protein
VTVEISIDISAVTAELSLLLNAEGRQRVQHVFNQSVDSGLIDMQLICNLVRSVTAVFCKDAHINLQLLFLIYGGHLIYSYAVVNAACPLLPMIKAGVAINV